MLAPAGAQEGRMRWTEEVRAPDKGCGGELMIRCITDVARCGGMPCGPTTCTSTGISRLMLLICRRGTGTDFAPVPTVILLLRIPPGRVPVSASRRRRAGFFCASMELLPGGDTLGTVRRVSLRGSLSKVDTVPAEEQAEAATGGGVAQRCGCEERFAAAANARLAGIFGWYTTSLRMSEAEVALLVAALVVVSGAVLAQVLAAALAGLSFGTAA